MKQVVLLLTFLLSCSAYAVGIYTVEKVPHPKLYNNSYVSDPDHVLTQETVQQINKELMLLERITTDQIAVVVVPSIGAASLKEFATALFNRFRIGQKDKDNGLLILLVMDQHRVEFETGYGLESVLPDAICKRIQLEQMVPKFQEKQYDQGLLNGVKAVVDVLSSTEASNMAKEEQQTSYAKKDDSLRWVIASFFAVPYFVVILSLFFVKRAKGSFKGEYNKLSEAKKRNILLPVSKSRWLFYYALLPGILYAVLLAFCRGPYLLPLLAVTAYLWLLLVLIDKKNRSKQTYALSFKQGNYYDQYNKFNTYFDNWGLAAVFFPIPFLFTDANNAKKMKAIRLHPRDCMNCGTPMRLLDDKKEDDYLQKSQIFEESIQSVDYDVWFCDQCHTHYTLGYNSKFSKYKPCTFCGTKASFLQSDVTKISPTYDSSGIGEKTYKCMYCEKVSTEEYTIPRRTRSSSSSSSGFSSGSSSSFGGGSSGGGGAGSSW